MKNLGALFSGQKSCNYGDFLQAVDFLGGWTMWKGGLPESSPLGEEGHHWGLNGLMARTREEQVFPALDCAPFSGVPQRDPGNCSLPTGYSKTPGIKESLRAGDTGPLESSSHSRDEFYLSIHLRQRNTYTERETFELFKIILWLIHHKG